MIKTTILYLTLFSLGNMISDSWMIYFYLPVAEITSLYLGIPLIHDSIRHCFIIDHPLYPLEIVRACSGFNFFCMIFTLLVFNEKSWHAKNILKLLLFTFGVTIIANSFRIICSHSARVWSTPWIGDHWQGALHESVGSLVFIVFGILAYLWKSNNLSFARTLFINSTRKET